MNLSDFLLMTLEVKDDGIKNERIKDEGVESRSRILYHNIELYLVHIFPLLSEFPICSLDMP